jgi:hypothetical protein
VKFHFLYIQGDQIGRILAYCGVVYFWLLFEKDKSISSYWDTIFHETNYVSILTKAGWATFYAILSQTHMVTHFTSQTKLNSQTFQTWIKTLESQLRF